MDTLTENISKLDIMNLQVVNLQKEKDELRINSENALTHQIQNAAEKESELNAKIDTLGMFKFKNCFL